MGVGVGGWGDCLCVRGSLTEIAYVHRKLRTLTAIANGVDVCLVDLTSS